MRGQLSAVVTIASHPSCPLRHRYNLNPFAFGAFEGSVECAWPRGQPSRSACRVFMSRMTMTCALASCIRDWTYTSTRPAVCGSAECTTFESPEPDLTQVVGEERKIATLQLSAEALSNQQGTWDQAVGPKDSRRTVPIANRQLCDRLPSVAAGETRCSPARNGQRPQRPMWLRSRAPEWPSVNEPWARCSHPCCLNWPLSATGHAA